VERSSQSGRLSGKGGFLKQLEKPDRLDFENQSAPMKQAHKARNLSRGWRAGGSLGKDRANGWISIIRQWQRSNRLEDGNALGSLGLVRSLVA
jgi:hypothetical protein